MRFATPDDAVRRWIEDVVTSKSIPAQSIGELRRKPAPECLNKACRFRGKPVPMSAKGGGTVPKCPRCSTVWATQEVLDLTGLYDHPSGGQPPARLVRSGDSAFMLARLRGVGPNPDGPTDGELLVQWIGVGSRTRSAMADDVNRELGVRAWTGRRIRCAHERAREWLRAELRYLGMLDEEREALYA